MGLVQTLGMSSLTVIKVFVFQVYLLLSALISMENVLKDFFPHISVHIELNCC